MIRRPPISTRALTPFPYTTLCRSHLRRRHRDQRGHRRRDCPAKHVHRPGRQVGRRHHRRRQPDRAASPPRRGQGLREPERRMKIVNNTRISIKLVAAFATLVLLIACLAGVTAYELSHARDRVADHTRITYITAEEP